MKRRGQSFRRRRPQRQGYTLVELLVVISMISILTALIAPAWNSTMTSSQIAQGATQIVTTLSLAAQKSSSDNRPVMIRFIKSADGEYRELLLVEIAPDGSAHALDRVVRLPESVAIAQNTTLSSILDSDIKTAGAGDPPVRGLTNYQYQELQFRPDGRLVLDIGETWFLTVLSVRDTMSATPPPNYATIQIDPVNGELNLYRP